MTSQSRTPAALQRPQIARSLSSSTSVQQRPQATQRSHSQYLGSAARSNENVVDLTFDTSNYGRTSALRLGSRLKTETANPSITNSPEEFPEAEHIDPQPRGRPAVIGFLGTDGTLWEASSNVQSIISTPSMDSQPRIMPAPRSRPGLHVKSATQLQKTASTTVVKKDIRPKPYTLEIPAIAPRYPPNGHIDFYPWTGNHIEDVWNDSVIRQGYFDRAPPSLHKETDTAKPTVFSGMKHKSGLQGLSNLFTNILAQRRAHGQITAPSTFKPPPRVTLTDTRRETWLKELANPATSLRKLSRTIPHGIRGKQLLEHCWAKNIPTGRAVWLAKCVGANEIRATKRKGATGTLVMGGEVKWIRDWTAIVEQFVESTVSACGEKDWRDRISYAVQLSAHLYTEHLLDRDHYMDWLTCSLETSSMAKLPMWVLVTQVYWKDFLMFRKHGRKLVAALCAHLHSAHISPDVDLLIPLIRRISSLLRDLLELHSESFLLPKVWDRYHETLMSYLASEDTMIAKLLGNIEYRNQQISTPRSENMHSSRHDLVSLLDRSILRPFTSSLAKECWQLPIGKSARISTVLEWTTSLYRPGITKIYVGARLLRNWSRSGVDVTDAVLVFLGSEVSATSCSSSLIYHLISELARSGHFSASRYLQWLIARGGIRGPADLAEGAPCPGRLLAELPINDLPDNIERMRNTMLSRADFSTDDEEMALERELTRLSALLPSFPGADPMDMDVDQDESERLGRSRLSRSIKVEIGFWLRSATKDHTVNPEPSDNGASPWKTEGASVPKSAITADEFNTVRGILEDIEDLSILADVLRIVSSSDNLQVLASVADSINRHLETFAAIGALADLFEILLGRLSDLSAVQRSDLITFLSPMAELAARMPDATSTANELSQELARRNSKCAAEACSPVSDEMAEVLQTADAEFSDEIEKVLASGNSMDPSTLGRLFSTILIRLEASWFKSPRQQQQCGVLLTRLRNFDTKHFDGLLGKWLAVFISRTSRPSLSQVLGPMIGQGCLGIVTVMDHCLANLDSESVPVRCVEESLDMLFGTIGCTEAMKIEDAYRLSIKRAQLYRELPAKTLSIIRKAISRFDKLPIESVDSVGALLRTPAALAFFQTFVLSDLDGINKGLILPLISSGSIHVQESMAKVVKFLLNPAGQNIPISDHTIAQRITYTMRLAGDLTLPFCQLELQMIFASEVEGLSSTDADFSCLEAFEGAIDAAVAADNTTWIGLVKILDPKIAQHLSERSERLFLEAVPLQNLTEDITTDVNSNIEAASRALFICDATSYSIQPARAIQTIGHIVDKCNEFWQILSSGDSYAANNIMQHWIPLHFDLIKIESAALDNSKPGHDSRCRLLLSLASLFLEVQKQNNASLATSIFDVCVLLVDDLPDESRAQCVRGIKDKTADPRLCYLFGYCPPPMDWLQLSQKGKLMPYPLRRWEILSEPTPNVGENDTSLSLTLFQARKV